MVKMGIEKRRVVVHEVLKNLCLNNGWSYAVFWSFHHPNSMLSTMEDAYYEDQMGAFVENMLLQVHMLGYGIVGNAAFAKTHKWTFAEDYRRDMNPLRSIGTCEISQDDSEIQSQFSSGMETIAVISVEPHGVVQFGSSHKVLETIQFIDQTKRLFREIDNCHELALPGSMPSSSNREIDSLSSLFLAPTSYSFSGNVEMINSSSSYNYMGTSSSIDIQDIYPFTLDHGVIKSLHIENQLKMTATESPYIHPNELFYNSPELLIDFPFSFPSTPMQSNLTNTFNPEKAIDNNIFENLGVEFREVENIFYDISTPVVNEGGLDFSKEVSECISGQRVGSGFSPRESLFSQLGIDQCFDRMTSEPYSFAGANSGNRLSSGNKRKRVICLDSQSCRSSFVSQPKKSEESVNVVKKKAKPGSRPKPKDRQQIQDHIAELRKLIPNGIKMSIDSLLAQTIKHMFFLESVTKHAENLKKADARKDNDYHGTLVFESRDHSMVDPVDVKDLRLPGQKQIQILCEEKGLFLEIVDMIHGFGLAILKGMMELREDKIWACFIVESEAKKYITKQEIYLSLRQQLYQRDSNEIIVANNSVNGVTNLFNNFHQHLFQDQIWRDIGNTM